MNNEVNSRLSLSASSEAVPITEQGQKQNQKTSSLNNPNHAALLTTNPDHPANPTAAKTNELPKGGVFGINTSQSPPKPIQKLDSAPPNPATAKKTDHFVVQLFKQFSKWIGGLNLGQLFSTNKAQTSGITDKSSNESSKLLDDLIHSEKPISQDDITKMNTYFQENGKKGAKQLANFIVSSDKTLERTSQLLKVLDSLKLNKPFADKILKEVMTKKNGNEHALALAKSMINVEMKSETSAGSLFRGNTMSLKIIAAFHDAVLNESGFVDSFKKDLSQIVSPKGEAYSLKDSSNPDKIKANQKRFTEDCNKAMDLMIDMTGSKEFPPEIVQFTRYWKEAVNEKFPGEGKSMASQHFFLRFMNPLIYEGKSTQNEKENRIAIGKLIQNLANGTLPRDDHYQFILSEMGKNSPLASKLQAVERNIQNMTPKEYLNDLAKPGKAIEVQDIVNDQFALEMFKSFSENAQNNEGLEAVLAIREFKNTAKTPESKEKSFNEFYDKFIKRDSVLEINISGNAREELDLAKAKINNKKVNYENLRQKLDEYEKDFSKVKEKLEQMKTDPDLSLNDQDLAILEKGRKFGVINESLEKTLNLPPTEKEEIKGFHALIGYVDTNVARAKILLAPVDIDVLLEKIESQQYASLNSAVVPNFISSLT